MVRGCAPLLVAAPSLILFMRVHGSLRRLHMNPWDRGENSVVEALCYVLLKESTLTGNRASGLLTQALYLYEVIDPHIRTALICTRVTGENSRTRSEPLRGVFATGKSSLTQTE